MIFRHQFFIGKTAGLLSDLHQILDCGVHFLLHSGIRRCKFHISKNGISYHVRRTADVEQTVAVDVGIVENDIQNLCILFISGHLGGRTSR